MTRRSITERDAKAYVKLVEERFASWIEAGYDGPKAIEDWDGRGHWGICWEGPYEWSFYGTTSSFGYDEREPEFGILLPKVEIPASLSHIWSEPYDSCVVLLYLDN